jgi:D-alanine--poly(phosphoribitol) ligase subunit 2
VNDTVRKIIHDKVVSLARELGHDASGLACDQEIPASGQLDSAAIMELIMWVETHFNLDIDQESLTIENFGTVDSIARYLDRAGKTA